MAVNVYLPKDRVTSTHQGYGFVEMRGEEDADYVSRSLHLLSPTLQEVSRCDLMGAAGMLTIRASEATLFGLLVKHIGLLWLNFFD